MAFLTEIKSEGNQNNMFCKFSFKFDFVNVTKTNNISPLNNEQSFANKLISMEINPNGNIKNDLHKLNSKYSPDTIFA